LRALAPVLGTWDRRRCEQMINQLLSNAVCYGERRPIEVDVTKEGDTAKLTVIDHGMGIPRRDQANIFELYERALPAHDVAGLGVGLWVVKRIAHALGGRVLVESSPGEGSAFTVELPVTGPPRKRSMPD